MQHRDGRGRDGLREGSPLRSRIGPSLEDQSRLRQRSLPVPVTSQNVPRGGLRKGRPRHREAFLRLARSSRKALSREIAHATVARRLQMCAATRKGAREAGRAERSSARFSRLDRSDGQNVDAQRARCHRNELGGMEGAVIGGRKSRLWLCECVHVPLRVFSCGEAEQGNALGGAMQCGGGRRGQASHDERSRCENVGREVRRWRGKESGGGSGPFIELESGGRPVHARFPIRAGAKPEARTPRSRL